MKIACSYIPLFPELPTETIMSARPFFSVITPTLQRDSLIRACRSLDEQTCDDWEHIIMVDTPQANYNLWDQIDPNEGFGKRKILLCDHPHADFGNTCRHNAWAF